MLLKEVFRNFYYCAKQSEMTGESISVEVDSVDVTNSLVKCITLDDYKKNKYIGKKTYLLSKEEKNLVLSVDIDSFKSSNIVILIFDNHSCMEKDKLKDFSNADFCFSKKSDYLIQESDKKR